MNAADLAVLNRRNRMTDAEREADIVREIFGPVVAGVLFPVVAPPVAPQDDAGGEA